MPNISIEICNNSITIILTVELYPGATTTLSMSRKYSIKFKCHFDLTLYPFDSQHCYMKLRVSGSTSDYIGFNHNSNARYNGSEVRAVDFA